jgi:hypothetical protein
LLLKKILGNVLEVTGGVVVVGDVGDAGIVVGVL